jgi:hypothetical protein
MSNQIKLTIDISDELINKVMTAIALSSATLPPDGWYAHDGASSTTRSR